jgi:uncharacterized membrane protein
MTDNFDSRRRKWTLATTGIVAALTALAALGTMIIRIPIPATTGYFNIGDAFVILAGLWLGPLAGLIVGAVGPTIADAIGYPQFILATMITKGLEGLLVGIIGGRRNVPPGRRVVAAAIGGITIIAGYFIFEAFIYPALGKMIPFFAVTDYGAALVEILPNAIQAIFAIIIGLGLWKAIGNLNASGRLRG